MNRFFNTPFEMQLRILMLLINCPFDKMDKYQFVCYDFICCYGKDYGVSESNLHGNSAYKFGEIASRKELVDMAIKELVTRGLVDVTQDNGFKYQINDNGINFIDSLDNVYGENYISTAEGAFEKYDLQKDESVRKFMADLVKRGGFTNVKN